MSNGLCSMPIGTHRRGVAVSYALSVWVVIFLISTCVASWGRSVDVRGVRVLPASGLIDLNRADGDTFCLLPGIGPQLSRRIVSVRSELGGFREVGQLRQVRGIGSVLISKIRPYVFCSPIEGGYSHGKGVVSDTLPGFDR